MIINYKDANGRIIELEVTQEVGNFYLTSLDDEKKNERRETRRHTSLSKFAYENMRVFNGGIDVCEEAALSEMVSRALDKLSDRQRYLFTKVFIEGWRYTEIAATEGRNESTIRKATEKAKEKFKKYFL